VPQFPVDPPPIYDRVTPEGLERALSGLQERSEKHGGLVQEGHLWSGPRTAGGRRTV